jgi:predicted HTH transcriptional regulator
MLNSIVLIKKTKLCFEDLFQLTVRNYPPSGSGVDKVVIQTELYQLPAPLFETTAEHTRAVLFAHRDLREMDKQDWVRACYLHACLRYVQRDFMTNTTLRVRFGIEDKNSAMASRIIRDALSEGLIRCHDETVGNKARKYVPWWA